MKIVIFLLGIFLAVNADAATYWVNTSASGQHCVNSGTDPGLGSSSQTITQGLACSGSAGTEHGGDTVMVNAGTYVEQIVDKIPSGTGAFSLFTLQCVSDGACLINPGTGNFAVGFNTATHWTLVRGFKTSNGKGWYSSGGAACLTSFHDMTFTNVEIDGTSADSDMMGFQGCGERMTFTGWNVHNLNGGGGLSHAIYISQYSDSFLVQNGTFSFNGAYCIHANDNADAVPDSNHTVRSNIFNNCGTVGVNGSAIIFNTNDGGHAVYNNIMYSNRAGVIFRESSSGVIYENTIYNNSIDGISDDFGSNHNFICRNNISIANGGQQIANCNTSDHNNTTDTATALFVNAGANDFHLKSTASGAIDQGFTLGAPYNVDFAGTARPQGSAYDIGAYEFIPTPSGAPTGMVAFNGGPGVAISSCGSGASVSGNDSSGKVTVGSGTVTTCSVNFSGTYGKAPNCIANINVATVGFSVAATASGFTLTTDGSNVAGDSINYLCVQTGKQ